MAINIDQLTKLYYSIGEVAELFGVSRSLIRFWESEFDILKPKKNRKGDRKFTVKDIENLEIIYNLVKVKGYTLEGAKRNIRLQKSEQKQKNLLIKKLRNIKSGLENLKDQIS